MRKLFKYIYFSIAFFFLFLIPVQAYIDPSVMSYAIQAIAGIAIALGTVLGLYWRKLVKAFRTIFRVRSNRHQDNESDDIVFTDPKDKKEFKPSDIKEREINNSVGKYLSVHTEKKQDTNEQNTSFSSKVITVIKELLPGVLIVLAITYMICYYAPLEIYMNNKIEFWFDYSVLQPQLLELCWTFLRIGLLLCLACYVIHKKLYKAFEFLGVASLVILYVQGNYLASDLPSMDGTEIDWTQYMPEMEQSAILCLVVIIAFALLYRILKDKKFTYIVDFTCVLITAMLAISLTDINNKQDGTADKQNDYVISKVNEYDYSSDKNFIIFVVDAFDSETFNSIVSEDEYYRNMFDGFTYYPDTVGAYTFTSRSIPYIMSGIWYENEGDYEEFEAQAVSDSPILKALEDEGYRLDAYEDEFLFDTDYSRYSNAIETETVLSDEYKLRQGELNISLFKYLPYFLKGNFEVNLNSFNETKETTDPDVEYYTMSDSDYYNDLQTTEITTTDQKVFKFIHIEGAHVPFNLDEDMNGIEGGTYVQKQKATLKILNEYMQKLKDSGVYDNSTILIMGDHGYVANPTDDENAVLARNNPLLMVKSAGESHELQWNYSSISYEYLQQAYQNLLNGTDGNTCFDGIEVSSEGRRFMMYYYTKETYITEYYQTGYATDMDTMIESGNIYEYTGDHEEYNHE